MTLRLATLDDIFVRLCRRVDRDIVFHSNRRKYVKLMRIIMQYDDLYTDLINTCRTTDPSILVRYIKLYVNKRLSLRRVNRLGEICEELLKRV